MALQKMLSRATRQSSWTFLSSTPTIPSPCQQTFQWPCPTVRERPCHLQPRTRCMSLLVPPVRPLPLKQASWRPPPSSRLRALHTMAVPSLVTLRLPCGMHRPGLRERDGIRSGQDLTSGMPSMQITMHGPHPRTSLPLLPPHSWLHLTILPNRLHRRMRHRVPPGNHLRTRTQMECAYTSSASSSA